MIIDPKQASMGDVYKLMVGSIVPRPIALVSTASEGGQPNLAPFSFFNAVTSRPPTICFSPGRRAADGVRKDTLRNIEETGEFVVNVVTEAIGPQMNATGADYPSDVDEFVVSGLTPVPSLIVKPPRVAESPIHMECTLYKAIPIGPDGPGGATLVIGEIVMFHVADSLYDSGRIRIDELKPLARLAGEDYSTLGRIVSMKRGAVPPGKQRDKS